MDVWVTKDAVYGGRKQCFTAEPKLVCAHYEGENRVILGKKDTPEILEKLLCAFTDGLETPCAVCVEITATPNR